MFQSTRLREARRIPTIRPTPIIGFNPRAYVRRDQLCHLRYDADEKFQSTRLREARQAQLSATIKTLSFQSTRLREARRRSYFPLLLIDFVSIHAPT